jgi:hypothetical protein
MAPTQYPTPAVYAYESTKGLYRNAMTDAGGRYKIYVEDGSWTIGGWAPSFGPLTETGAVIAGSSVSNLNFYHRRLGLPEHYRGGSARQSLRNRSRRARTSFAEPTDGDYSKGGYAFSDDLGNYSLAVKPGTYNLRAFHPKYGEIGVIPNITIAGSDYATRFTIPLPKRLDVSFTGSGLPSDLSNFSWSIDAQDRTSGRNMSQSFRSKTSYTFEHVSLPEPIRYRCAYKESGKSSLREASM